GLQTAFGLALLWLWVRTVSLTDVAAHIRVQRWWVLPLMVLIFVITSVMRARRWQWLLRSLAPVGMVRAFAMNAAGGLLNYVLPIRSGDAARAWWLWRRHRVPAGSALATIVIDKACDLAGVALVLAVLAVVAATGVVAAPRGLLGATALAVGVDVPTWKAMAAYPALLLSFAVPAGPGYLGNLEVAGALVLGGGLGLAPAVAAGAIVVYHAVTAAYALVLGLFGFLLVGGRRQAQAGAPRRVAVFHCGFDAIIGCNQPSAWIAWWAARLIDVPYVVYLNQPNRLVYPRSIDRQTGWFVNSDYRLLAAIVLRATRFVAWADRRSVQEADQLLVNGDYIGDIIRGIYKRDAIDCPAGCHVVSSGYPLSLQSRFSGGLTINGYPIRRPYVLLTNRHYPQKRFDLAIRAMALVREKHPRAQLVVPGPATAHTAELHALVKERGLGDAVL